MVQGHTVNMIYGYCEKGDLSSYLQRVQRVVSSTHTPQSAGCSSVQHVDASHAKHWSCAQACYQCTCYQCLQERRRLPAAATASDGCSSSSCRAGYSCKVNQASSGC